MYKIEHSYYEQGRGSLSAYSHMDTSDTLQSDLINLRVYRNN